MAQVKKTAPSTAQFEHGDSFYLLRLSDLNARYEGGTKSVLIPCKRWQEGDRAALRALEESFTLDSFQVEELARTLERYSVVNMLTRVIMGEGR